MGERCGDQSLPQFYALSGSLAAKDHKLLDLEKMPSISYGEKYNSLLMIHLNSLSFMVFVSRVSISFLKYIKLKLLQALVRMA